MITAVDLIVGGGSLLTVDEEGTVLPRGGVAVRDGIIVDLGPVPELLARYEATDVIDSTGCVVLPGWVNTHTHLAMNVFRGAADDVTLEEFLERLVSAELRVLSGEMVAVGARAAIAECLKGGTTTALDMYWYPQATRAVAAETGFRLLNGPTFMGDTDPEGRDFETLLDLADEILQAHRSERPHEDLWIMPHSTYTLDDAQLRRIRQLASRHGARINTHCAENHAEVSSVESLHGGSPVEVLARVQLLGKTTVLAHSVQLSENDIRLIAEAGASVSHCPISNLKLGCGIAPVPALLAAGVTVGIGTDGAASAGAVDMLSSVRMAALLHKGATIDPTVITAQQAIRMGTVDSARSVGLRDVGTLEIGMRADLQVVRVDTLNSAPTQDPWSAIVYGSSASDVRYTIVGGRVLLRDGILTTIDEQAALLALAQAATEAGVS